MEKEVEIEKKKVSYNPTMRGTCLYYMTKELFKVAQAKGWVDVQ